MALTRGSTGNARPRKFETAPTTTTTTTTKKRTTTAKPRTKTATGRVSKTGTGVTGAHHKRKPSIKDKVAGAVEKVKGTVEGKPGKKAAGTRRMHGTDGKKKTTVRKV